MHTHAFTPRPPSTSLSVMPRNFSAPRQGEEFSLAGTKGFISLQILILLRNARKPVMVQEFVYLYTHTHTHLFFALSDLDWWQGT